MSPSVVQREKPVDPDERRAGAHRYLGQDFGDLYLQSSEADAVNSVMFRMQPESWFTSDFAKAVE